MVLWVGTGIAEPGGMNTSQGLLSSTLMVLLSAACTGGVGDEVVTEPSEVAQAISQSVGELASVQSVQVPLAEGLFSIPGATPVGDMDVTSCAQVETLVNQGCALLEGISDGGYCWAESTFFMAHSQPRCATRLHLSGDMEQIYAFDLTSAPREIPELCGNGEVDEGEMCDDGNREDFDGCSQLCEVEEFQGCEAVIEQYYQDAQLAFVDRNLWDGPRSHLMVNKTAEALAEVDQRTCDAALAIGVDVCNELTATMPFVGGCHPMGGLRQGELGAACDLRFEVYFQNISPADGVFTTAMPGILAFTLE